MPIIDDDDPIWIDKVTRKFLNMTPMSFPSKSHFGSPKPTLASEWRKLPLGIKIIQNRRTGPIRQRVQKRVAARPIKNRERERQRLEAISARSGQYRAARGRPRSSLALKKSMPAKVPIKSECGRIGKARPKVLSRCISTVLGDT